MTHPAADPRTLLALWEQALPLAPAARETLLAGTPARGSLGAQRRALLVGLQQQGADRLALHCHCPACAEAAELQVALSDLLQSLPDPDAWSTAAADHLLDDGAWSLRFRLPTPVDLQALAGEAEVERFVHALLQRCVLEARLDGRPVAAASLPPDLCDRLSNCMEVLDSAATLALAVTCPACGHAWSALFDPGLALWTSLQSQAEQWLLDIDTLARRYGWAEDQILSLSPGRRQAYLQLARAQADA